MKGWINPKLLLMILNFFALASSAQTPGNDYDEYWKKVKNFETKGLTTSAMNEVNLIYQLAKKDKNEPQVIKSLLYKNKLSANITEDATKKMIDTLQQEIEVANQPAKSILQNITAQLYQNYFAYNRYRLYSASNTEGFKKDDIATWSADDFIQKIASLYEASLQEKQNQKISLTPFNAIIEEGNVRYLRPTLFDLLAHNALNFFKSSENNIRRPAYAFEITDEKAFSPAREFIKTDFISQDTGSLHLKALQVFQELISLHLNDIKPLIDVDLERLEFVNEYAVMPDKNNLYINALKFIFENYKDNAAAEAGYLWAMELRNNLSEVTSRHHAEQVLQSVQILEKVIKLFPGSNGAANAENELKNIQHPSLSVQTEKVNVINKPFRALVSYSNIDGIYLRLIPITKKQKESIRESESSEGKKFQNMASLKPIREWKQLLPNMKDYLVHKTEIKIDGLQSGEYILLASKDKDFSTGKNLMAANFVYISDISYVNNGRDYFVLNRNSGAAIASAEVVVFKRNYNYYTGKYSSVSIGKYRTDKNGYFQIAQNISDNLYNLQLAINTANDQLHLDDFQRIYSYNNTFPWEDYKNQTELNSSAAKIFFFTDRSLYRPGQIVYYKGIGITKGLHSRKSELLKTKSPIEVSLYNANGEKIDSAMVTLNEYGSISGKFILPNNQLTGTFSISAKGFSGREVNFSVEEYKRPKFFAEFEPLKGTYRVNDTIQITGKAEAYAGNRIDGAKVSYRVMRMARFLYPWRFWRTGLPPVSQLEIAHGEATTDENGNFTIHFKAIPDLQVDPSTDPVFDYRVNADITDINGETRSTQITVPVGYKGLNLQIEMNDKSTFISNDLKAILVTAKNLSDNPQQVLSQIKIFRLITPDRVLRKRFWSTPDTFVISRDEYEKLFPNDVYKDEDQQETWPSKNTILDVRDSVNGTHSIPLGTALKTGWYRAEVSATDHFGNEVKDIKYFRILQPENTKIILPEYVITTNNQKKLSPGETATFYISTPDDINLIQQKDTIITTRSDKAPESKFYSCNHQIKSFPFDIKDDDRGGFGVMNLFVKNNRLYFFKSIVNVPWDNKELDIHFDTYRDKTLPGSKENWKITIKGFKGEKVAAEMLTSMYDASLDQFKPHHWNTPNLWPVYTSSNNWEGGQNFSSLNSFDLDFSVSYKQVTPKIYDRISPLPEYFEAPLAARRTMKRSAIKESNEDITSDQATLKELVQGSIDIYAKASPAPSVSDNILSGSTENTLESNPIRTNLNETAFFYPDLRTDEKGNISFSFTMPEALTTWRLMAQAHTKDLAIGYAEKSVVTQKDLMIIPNPPRFFREGDQMEFSAKVVNMTDKSIEAVTEFHLLNATTLLPVDGWFKNTTIRKLVSIPANQSKPVTFSIEIPKGFNDMVVYRIVATADNQSDGEEAFIPVVTNRMLVTESMPLEMKQNGTKTFSFDKLLQSGHSASLENYGLTVEYTSNPVWYAVQALPYLKNYPYECTEQIFNRYFANALAMNIVNSSPGLKAVFEKWRHADSTALLSNLQKNQELKSILLEETPWVLQAKNEEQQKKNIALLFDVVSMTSQLDGALKIVKERQSPNGGFVWFKGGPDDRYMTQYIIADMGHLKKLNAWPAKNDADLSAIVKRAITYLDAHLVKDYQTLKKSGQKLSDNNLNPIAIHYLYARSFFPEIALADNAREAFSYYEGQARKYWLHTGIYNQGMIALTLFRAGDQKTSRDIIKSLKENSITDPNLGMYWKAFKQRGWFWYQAPIESQSLMIEVFSEVTNDTKSVAELKTWLLKNKQTNNWNTTKATAEAVYALLLQGDDWLVQDKEVQIRLGSTSFDSKNEKQEAGTGYFERRIDGSKVTPDMGNITVTVTRYGLKNENNSPSWGSVYWQYFEDLDKITFAETPLKLSKKLFVEKNTDRGPVLTPVNAGDIIHVGDKIKVRIELRADRDMEYVHMKDMRASTMEPVNVLSQYKWQGGLGYYESTKDASTNFFFSYLPKGTYVFEYPMFVNQSGDFSNGITTIQCMYAPEFTAHSEGIRVKVSD